MQAEATWLLAEIDQAIEQTGAQFMQRPFSLSVCFSREPAPPFRQCRKTAVCSVGAIKRLRKASPWLWS